MRITTFVCSLLLSITPAFAWNESGHMVTGALAYDVLMKDDPKAVDRIVDLLKSHPQADVFKKRLEAVPANVRNRYLFMIAARWPDDIRRDEQFHRGPWHYINYPVVPADPSDRSETAPPAPPEDNLVTSLRSNRAALQGDDAAAKAVAITWIFHQVGDIHQPCHAVAYFSKWKPEGDRGGNDCYVRTGPAGAVINVHSLWDGLILADHSYGATGNEATKLRLRDDLSPDKLPGDVNELDTDVWTRESVALAERLVYWNRILKGGTQRSSGPILPDGYLTAAKFAAEQRVVLSGYRLANLLKDAVD